tara:strand:+ start:166 stop:417 length:252 start_codon:yes stop_codon:yes gene_type:complete
MRWSVPAKNTRNRIEQQNMGAAANWSTFLIYRFMVLITGNGDGCEIHPNENVSWGEGLYWISARASIQNNRTSLLAEKRDQSI